MLLNEIEFYNVRDNKYCLSHLFKILRIQYKCKLIYIIIHSCSYFKSTRIINNISFLFYFICFVIILKS